MSWPEDEKAFQRCDSCGYGLDGQADRPACTTARLGRLVCPVPPDDEGAVWNEPAPNSWVRRELAFADRLGLGSALVQHARRSSEDPFFEHFASGIAGQLHLLIDSAVIRVEGEGEWNTHNDALRSCHRLGQAIWKRWSGYHRRSLVEAKMRCFELLGERFMTRDFDRPVTELQISAVILNRFIPLGTPLSQRAG